jgi:hypothetical protein
VGSGILLQLDSLQEEEGLRFRLRSWRVNAGAEPLGVTILFIPLSALPHKLESDWAGDCDKISLPQCPVCDQGSIIGHGRRRKQAHDEYHDWIEIRRGRCPDCGKTFTFLPLFSFPYTHYSLLARCQALRRRLVENCSWEKALPNLKDSNRLPDPSTLCLPMDGSWPAQAAKKHSFVNSAITCIRSVIYSTSPSKSFRISFDTPLPQRCFEPVSAFRS